MIYLARKKLSFFGNMIEVSGDDARYLFKVRRVEPGEMVLFYHEGMLYETTLSDVTRKGGLFSIMRRSAVVSGKTKIYPVIAAADWQALEAAVRNGIEAGAHDFFLFKSNRSNIPESALVKRFPRLEQIIESAASQSRRRYLPTVRAIGREVLLRRPGRHIVLHPATGLPLEELLRPTGDLPEDLYLWIGPEGGFDDEEIDSFVHHGAQCALLNTPILRLENAVTLAVGMARHLRGDQTTETMLPG